MHMVEKRLGKKNLACLLRTASFCIAIAFLHSTTAQGPPTVANALKDLGIDLSHTSLIKALSDSRPGVRSLASSQIATQEGQNAIPFVEKALRDERVPQTALNMAVVLTSLGDQAGADRLVSFCQDATKTPDQRTFAAVQLASLKHDYSCAPSILTIAAQETGSRESELLYLAELPETEKGKAPFGPVLSKIALSDPDPLNRKLAQKALIKLGGKP